MTEAPDEDLSLILTGLMRAARRKTDAGRQTLANDELTREYLEAGRRLIDTQLGPGDDGDTDDRPLFRWLSQRTVIDEVAKGGRLRGSEGTFRDRWPYQPDYIRDVLAYVLRGAHWQEFVDRTAGARDRLADAEDVARAVHDAGYEDLVVSLRSPALRAQLIGTAMAARDEIARTTMRQMYQISTQAWQDAYEKAAAARGLKVRPGLTIADLNYILTACSEGMQMRLLVEPEDGVIDHERRTSLLGTAALALIAACFDHFDDGLSLEDVVGLATGPAAAPPDPEDGAGGPA
ncbi:hypothetical protein I6A84_40580 [Frankia sp. CNm7]|uniref:Uncharacterized protein n=1 Tax=Frankia nepalensis TaxID=1836974 RepID=A0A937RD87_9ACTN|nr:hypothetical protein [Frankia nepalensis]MBL7495899.1 hypothetical protein [Frankia nepalensis]MBL7510374.1 hypothetical protein [Frankia nepalensis]MBL7524172.1 hypothetical protein [Frankia nepalensis]MBL7629973.1 hypothetical protein [Frankia nepalensis]